MKNYYALVLLLALFFVGNEAYAQCAGSELIGNADNTTVFNDITNPEEALGAPDGTITGFLEDDDALLLDLSDTIPAGNTISIDMSRINNDGRATLEGSLDGRNFYDGDTDVGASFTTGVITTYAFSVTRPTRYVRIDRTAGALGVDGVAYNVCPDSDMDGVIDATEILNGDDRFDPCDPSYVSADWLDCDGDKVPNSAETSVNGQDPCSPADFSKVCDTDGDGVSDAYDDCPGTTPGTFVTARGCDTGLTCSFTVSEENDNTFTATTVWTSPEDIDARETPLVGDVTGDGVPNVVVDDYGDQLFVINGETGATEYTINVSGTDQLNQNNSANAIGDVDGDGYGEIFVLKKNLQWSRFDFDGSTWTETTSGSTAAELADVFRYTPQLADFNGDGNVELFSGSQIWNADFSGAVDIIADGGVNVGDLGGSVAIDILPDAFCADCAGLELVVGGSVFSVNIGTGTITEQVAANGLSATAKLSFGTGVADVDGDGDFDVAYMQEDGVNTIFYVWDGQTNTILLQYTLPNSGTKHGRVNIADFDGDGFLEFGLHYEDDTNTDLAYYAVIEDLITTSTGTLVWRVETNDGSGKTGTTVYDFDGDGAAEVVYRDETDLRIFRGKDGFVLFLTPCSSITRYELPITADVNGDGLANLLCTCDDIGLTLFESASDPWVPARAVWNQHSYNITNVNDDLTIPTSPNNNLSVAGGRFNNHLVQSPPVLISGEPEVNSDPDATITAVAINTKSGCPGGIDIDVTIGNLGDKDLSSSTLLSVYDADPELIAANLLHSQTIGRMVAVSGSQTITVTVPSCFSGTYHFVVNDPGTGTLPYSFTTDFPISGVSECDYTNNDNQLSVTLPIELTTFDARPVDQDVLLTWRTETELQNDYFTVEHSLDNRNWKTIAVVEGAGNSSLPINYEAYDRQPFKGLNYYRLKQTDFDGAFTYSEIRSVRFNTLEAGEWTLYPNPAKATLTLESQGLETGPIQLFNAFGAKQQVVLLNRQETSTGGVQINLSVDHLPPGVYHLSIGNASYRFVKL